MQGLRISDQESGHLAFDLSDLVALLDDRVDQSEWLCLVSECIPTDPNRENLEEEFAASTLASGAEFRSLVAQTRQVIDGVFQGFLERESDPWITLQAVDSSFWEVFARSPDDLARFEHHFQQVSHIKQGAT